MSRNEVLELFYIYVKKLRGLLAPKNLMLCQFCWHSTWQDGRKYFIDCLQDPCPRNSSCPCTEAFYLERSSISCAEEFHPDWSLAQGQFLLLYWGDPHRESVTEKTGPKHQDSPGYIWRKRWTGDNVRIPTRTSKAKWQHQNLGIMPQQ